MRLVHRGTLIALATAFLWVAAPAAGKGGSAKKAKSMGESTTFYSLKLICNASYLAGFPLLVAAEVRNVSATHYDNIPVFDLFSVPGPVAFALRGEGREWTWPVRRWPRSDEPGLTEFGPGKAWLALQELSELHPDIPPGHYQLTASIMFPGELVEAAPVAFEVRAASKEDLKIAARLRADNVERKHSWLELVRRNPTVVSGEGLSATAQAQVDYYLYLHHVALSVQPLASLRPDETDRFAHGSLEAEAAVLRLEILHAAGRPEAAGVEAAVLERWPGLVWRVGKIRTGGGTLAWLRASHASPRRSGQ
jgi:hypothetical protein